MTARDLMIARLTYGMAYCNAILVAFTSYITWQISYFRQLPTSIHSILGEDPRASLYSVQMQYYIDRIFSKAGPIAISIQREMENIADLLRDVKSLSIQQLFSLKERVDTLSSILENLVRICNEKGTLFLQYYKKFAENLIAERSLSEKLNLETEDNC